MLETKDYGDTTFVTGMRAYAALGVLLIHAGGAGLRAFGAWGSILVDLGRYGVHAFFVISGFAAASSLSKMSVGEFLYSRFFRLAPLFYFWLVLALLLFGREQAWAVSNGRLNGWVDLGLHGLFLHGWWLQSANSILGVEWTLSVEALWFLCAPGLLGIIDRGWAKSLVFVALLWEIVANVLLTRWMRTDDAWHLVKLWHPAMFFFSFTLGLWAFRLRGRAQAEGSRVGPWLGLMLPFVFWVLSVARGSFVMPAAMMVYVSVFFCLVFGYSAHVLYRWLFMSRGALVLGTLSYGIYLCHYLVMNALEQAGGALYNDLFLRFLVVVLIAMLLSGTLYLLVERPCQRWAKRFWPLVNKWSRG